MRDFFRGTPARFLAGFLLAGVGSLVIVSLIQGPPRGFGFLVPMSAVGIFGGVLWVRRPPKFFTGARED